MNPEKHSVLLCSNQSLVRTGLRFLLQEAGWGEVVESPLKPPLALQAERSLPLGIAIVDASQAWELCLSVVGQIQKAEPLVPVLVLSTHKESRYARNALQMGARGYVLEQSSKEEFRVACWAVHQGGVYIDPQVLPGVLQDLGRPEAEARKSTILAGLLKGADNQTLATELSLSVSSVKITVRELFVEYGVRNRLELLAAIGSHNQFRSEHP